MCGGWVLVLQVRGHTEPLERGGEYHHRGWLTCLAGVTLERIAP